MTARPPLSSPRADESDGWPEIAALMGREIAEPLSAALERVVQLTATGRIDRDALRALRSEVERARRVGIVGQQLARFASKRLRQSHERLDLGRTLQALLTHRARELGDRDVTCAQGSRPVEVLVDPALLFSLLNAVIDWAVAAASTRVELRIDLKDWPPHGRLRCGFGPGPADPDAAEAVLRQSLDGQLIDHVARTMGLTLLCEADGPRTLLTLEFPRTVNEILEGVTAIELDHGDGASLNSKPLAGSHVLVVAARRDMRQRVREAIAHLGLVIDFVGSVDEAIDFCREGLPHAIVFEAVLRGERFDQFAAEVRTEAPAFTFIEIAEEGNAFEVSGFNGMEHARVGRDGLLQALPSALVFELSKHP